MSEGYPNLQYPDDFIIKTGRLLLRPPEIIDSPELFKHASDEGITTFLSWAAHGSEETTRTLLISLQEAQMNDRGYHWLIVADGKIAGFISLIDVRRTHRTWTINRAELSYWLGAEFQNKGYVTEAGKAILDFGFSKLGLHKIVLGHVPENERSAAIAKRLGFEQYGLEKDAFFKHNRWYAMLWYAVFGK